MHCPKKLSEITQEQATPQTYRLTWSIRWLAGLLGLITVFGIGLSGMAIGEYNKIGGNGGKPHLLQCPPNQFAVGMATRHDGSVLIQLNLRCVSVNSANGNWSGTPRWVGHSPTDRWQGQQGLQSQNVSCPENQFIESSIFGRTGKVGFATVVRGLEWRCVRFSQIDPSQGKSRKTRGTGQFGVGFIFGEGQPQQSRDGTATDSALHALHLTYGLAIDSVSLSALHMPWTTSSQALQSAPSPRVGRSPRIGRQPAAATAPDLTVRLVSTLWRYSGTTRRNGITFRKVPEAFCSSGMIPRDGGRSATKTFDLPEIQYQVKNSGSAATTRNFTIQTRFGPQVGTVTAPVLQPGQRSSRTIAREERVRRCVTNSGVLGGCHECAGQSNFQDPQLQINIDSTNVITESNETNNQLTN